MNLPRNLLFAIQNQFISKLDIYGDRKSLLIVKFCYLIILFYIANYKSLAVIIGKRYKSRTIYIHIHTTEICKYVY